MNIEIEVEGLKEVVGACECMVANSGQNVSDVLDRAAKDVQDRMKREAPDRKGVLKESISVEKVAKLIREIEPLARNVAGKGKKYAYYVEHGSDPGYWPNIESLLMYTGNNKEAAWAFAHSIHNKGTRANPFVSRTFDWAKTQTNNWGRQVLDKVEKDFK